MKGTNIRIIGVPEKEEREWAETVFEETGQRIFLKQFKDVNLQI